MELATRAVNAPTKEDLPAVIALQGKTFIQMFIFIKMFSYKDFIKITSYPIKPEKTIFLRID